MTPCDSDEEREYRIRDEAIVDAHGSEEQAIGWYYYLADRIQFPIVVACSKKVSISPLDPHQRVTAVSMANVNVCEHDMFITVETDNGNIDVPLSQLHPQEASEDTEEAISDWHYWIDRGYCL